MHALLQSLYLVCFCKSKQKELLCNLTWRRSAWHWRGPVFESLLLCLHPPFAALLDLPVQPSATEVLGFGQTANASPSALPFRFYEQSRRAPNDPTANRSVFASVDKVPGDTALTHCFSLYTTAERLICLCSFLYFKSLHSRYWLTNPGYSMRNVVTVNNGTSRYLNFSKTFAFESFRKHVWQLFNPNIQHLFKWVRNL